ncbi:MAG: hypothetical protein IT235_08475 [Bacteroidia bacterium]|nr:hypothetical protein [Bacteroidia bacterium]
MKIPTDLFLKGIRARKVYYFSNNKINTEIPHYYVCIKRTDADVLILSLCTSQFETIKRFVESRNLPFETLVFIAPDIHNPFTKQTYVNCNEIHEFTVEELKEMYESEAVEFSGEISEGHYVQILLGLKASPMIDDETKDLLPDLS